MTARRYLLVRNASAGSGSDAETLEAARRRLPNVEEVALEPATDLGREVGTALAEERIVVAAGGDGTVSAVASHVTGEGILGVLPLGTLNHFARDLGLGDAAAAIEALLAGAVRRVDVGRAGDRVFVNNVGLGLYPDLVRRREGLERRIGKWPAMAVAALATASQPRPLRGTIRVDGDESPLDAWAVFVGNNRVSAEPGSVGERDRLDEGVLDLWTIVGADLRGRARAAWRTARRRPALGADVDRRDARRVQLRLHAPRLLSRDGEVEPALVELEVSVEPRALQVLGPS